MRSIHPVISFVIILFVVMMISLAFGYWLSDTTKREMIVSEVEIQNTLASYREDSAQWNITLIIRNTGTSPVTIDQIIINRVTGTLKNAYLTYSYKAYRDPASGIIIIEPGGEAHVSFTLNSKNPDKSSPYYREPVINGSFVHGQLVSIILHSATGEEYPATLVLP